MALTADDIIKIMEKAAELGLIETKEKQEPKTLSEKDIEQAFKIQTPFDEMSEEEILFYATPHFDELQRQKEEKKQRISEEVKERRDG
jgi:arginine utilization protein RocB